MTNIKIGDKAPDFSINTTEGKSITLQSLLGKYIILYFYPKDDTPGCTVEAQDFNELIDELNDLNTVVLGVSKDSIKSHDKFKAKYNLKFDLASDIEATLCNKYGVWVEKSMFGKKYMGINRATFLIDSDGKIAHIWPKVSVNGHARDVIKQLKDLTS